MYHHSTIRKYVAALLETFNDIEIQYKNSNDVVLSKNVPINFSSREKSLIINRLTSEQTLTKNINYLPRASLVFSSMSKADSRAANKNAKVGTYQSKDTMEYMFNSVPYVFNFDVVVQCRGMNEATMIIEQIAPMFNPTLNIDIRDASNLSEPTRIPVKLTNIDFENEAFEDLSSNIVTITFSLELTGNLYPAIKTVERIKEFKMFLNETLDMQTYTKKTIFNWDVDSDGVPGNLEITQLSDITDQHPPTIIDISSSHVTTVGSNEIFVIWDDKDDTIREVTFEWEVIYADAGVNAVVEGDKDQATLTVTSPGNVEVQVKITDPYGNYATGTKIFTVT